MIMDETVVGSLIMIGITIENRMVFHEIFGRGDLVVKTPMWDYFSFRNYFSYN
jgi:hypothetical protein